MKSHRLWHELTKGQNVHVFLTSICLSYTTEKRSLCNRFPAGEEGTFQRRELRSQQRQLQSTYWDEHGRAAAEKEEMLRKKLESGLLVFRWRRCQENPTRWPSRDHSGVVMVVCTSFRCCGEKTKDKKTFNVFYFNQPNQKYLIYLTSLTRNKYHFT